MSLLDDRINFLGLSEAKEISFLNFDNLIAEDLSLSQRRDLSLVFTISQKVIHQKRIVYDTFMMLGDVGGLNDFFLIILTASIGLFSERLMYAKLVETLFMQLETGQ